MVESHQNRCKTATHCCTVGLLHVEQHDASFVKRIHFKRKSSTRSWLENQRKHSSQRSSWISWTRKHQQRADVIHKDTSIELSFYLLDFNQYNLLLRKRGTRSEPIYTRTQLVANKCSRQMAVKTAAIACSKLDKQRNCWTKTYRLLARSKQGHQGTKQKQKDSENKIVLQKRLEEIDTITKKQKQAVKEFNSRNLKLLKL